MEENKPKTGQMLRGQAWIELHGEFTPAQLRALADEIEKNCKGLERKDVDKDGLNDQLDCKSTDN